MAQHYQTLHDETLLDVEVVDGVMILRAGRSLIPSERPEILRLSYADWFDLVRAGTDLFIAEVLARRTAVASGAERSALYEVAKKVCHEHGLDWTDPRSGVTYPPPKKVT